MTSVINTVEAYFAFVREDYVPTIKNAKVSKSVVQAYKKDNDAWKTLRNSAIAIAVIGFVALYFAPKTTICTIVSLAIAHTVVLFNKHQSKPAVQKFAEKTKTHATSFFGWANGKADSFINYMEK